MKYRWIVHPLFVFILSLIALGASLYLYISSYIGVNRSFTKFVESRNLDASGFLDKETWVMVLIMSVLVGLIIAGLALIFVYYQKMIQLYRLQQNFISGFTHELKTPIASLRLFIDTFARHDLAEVDRLKVIDYMRRDTDRMSDNVNQILNLAKMEEKQYQSELLLTQLDLFSKEWIENSEDLFDGSEISFSSESGEYGVWLDPKLFEMLLSNLITNGLYYNHSTSKKIQIHLKADNQNVVIRVKDNGVGLEQNELKKVFRKFYQVGKSAKGSGLGLYFVHHIVKLHLGSIRVESSGKDMGCTFIVKLPKRNLK
ncbi:MAG: HAMP domain-containing histidine kinase [Halobacteriovoraceae bacterium]|nr:HAMP domain-containing histidine kinase [Halobacteriovoraceae bacterium]